MNSTGSSRKDSRRLLLLWLFALWLAALATASFWRAVTLWQSRALLAELGSTLCSATSDRCTGLVLFVVLHVLGGIVLMLSAYGLWRRQPWVRCLTLVAVMDYYATVQAYTWLFVRTGLLWERRWVALFLALVTTGIVLGALTWRRSRQWLGLL
ncbi:MAG: hypothetical protein JXA89_04295 [Anaerolineae bacterium]|nr:hypothetical protein [Anaerolineae bacterium]